MPVSALKRATIETVAIDPKADGKVEVTFRIIADQKGLTDCAAAFIQAGVSGLELLDVFSVLLPANLELGLEPPGVSPNVVPLDRVRGVSGAPAVSGYDFSEMNAPLTAAHEDGVTGAGLTALYAFHDVSSRLSHCEGLLAAIYRMLTDHDHWARNSIQALTFGMDRAKRGAKPVAAFVAASLCGHHGVCSLVDALLSLPGA
jgi:hypothetical protein